MNNTRTDRWDDRYSKDEFAYGEKPNNYLKEQLEKLAVGTILFPAEGEGRNAVFFNNYFTIAFQKGVANNKFLWANTSIEYFNSQIEKFDAIINLNKLKKIKAQEWITPCD